MYIFTDSKGAHSRMMNGHGQSDIMLSSIRKKIYFWFKDIYVEVHFWD